VKDIQTYYVNLDAPITTKKHSKRWNAVLEDLKKLAMMPTSTEPQPFPTYSEDEEAGTEE